MSALKIYSTKRRKNDFLNMIRSDEQKNNLAFVDGQNIYMKASSLYKNIALKYRADLSVEPVRRKIKKEKGSLGS